MTAARKRTSAGDRPPGRRRLLRRITRKVPRRRAESWAGRVVQLALRHWIALLVVFSIAAVTFGMWVFQPYWSVLHQFSSSARTIPSRVYERPPELERGQRLSRGDFERMLVVRGYRRAVDGELGIGRYRDEGGTVEVHLRSFPTRDGWTVPLQVTFHFRGGRLSDLRLADGARLLDGADGSDGGPRRIEAAWLDPRLIRTFPSPDGGDRWPVRLEELPEHVVRAILAAEDARFFEHRGVSLRGIVRAFLSNLDGEGHMQGGSTLTQQLVKNLYLTPERKLSRKVREAFLAVYLELRYEKEAILEAYLNEIYLGRRGGANLMGIGAASRAFFGIPPEEMDLAQAATIAGMINSPANLTPDRHQEQSMARRRWVLDRMTALRWIDGGEAEAAREAPVQTASAATVRATGSRYAGDAILAELRERYGLESLGDGGYVVISTLDGTQQEAAEAALRRGLDDLQGRVRRHGDAELQGALVAADPRDGAIRAWVGGRDYGRSQFDRVRQARRQVGSAFKPVVLAAAFSERAARVSDLLEDEPLTVELDGRKWSPRNADDDFHGRVTVREAIERSLNVPTVRLALDVGLDKVVAWGRRLGIESPLRPLPSIALGAFEMTPLELLGVYATLANEGRRARLHLVEGVLDRDGTPLEGRPLGEPERVLEPGVSHLVTSVLEGVVQRGTGRGLAAREVRGAVAAKSGTTNDRKDAWFAGYTPSSVAVVWVGYDDPATTGLSGTSGAMPIFGAFLEAVEPVAGYGVFRQPADVTTRTVDPLTGELAVDRCPIYSVEVFLRDDVPTETCSLHSQERRGFWRRVFGRRDGDS